MMDVFPPGRPQPATPRLHAVILVCISIFLLGAAPAAAAGGMLSSEFGASPWADAQRSAARLLGGGRSEDGRVARAGLEIRLAPNFKTYWRSPGDSGIPPAFDWSGSENVSGVDVAFPAPERFEDAGGFSIGYTRDVVLPLSVKVVDSAKPVRLALKLDYAVCEKLCIPAKAELAMVLPHRSGQAVLKLLAVAEDRVPETLPFGAPQAKLAVKSLTVQDTKEGASLVVSIAALDGEITDVFAEAAGLWLFGKPALEAEGDGTIARIPIEDRPKDAIGTLPVTITVTSTAGAIETKADLDAGSIPR